jgi:sterol desaturase/sphingolipid hydroxylase (fatty acid hydroxylase superfamily)
VLATAAIFIAGLFAWTFIEYFIHGWMSHRLNTFVTPLHDAHHRDPHAVFTIGAWMPAFAIWLLGFGLFGFSRWFVFYTGTLAGFMIYEAVHYRIHFAYPASRLEERLRTRHLVHHYRAPDACFGVTTGLWDLVFRSGLDDKRMEQFRAPVKDIAPLTGPSNLRRLRYLGIPAR